MDYYTILGVSKNASTEEIKKAYRKLAHQYHPDKQGGDEKKFKEINQAYQILGNKEKREQYDRFGQGFGEGQAGAGFSGFDFSSFSRGGFDFSGIDLGDIFENLAGFNPFGFSQRQRQRDLNRGRDIHIDFEIGLEEAGKGLEEKVILSKMVICGRCEGRGGEPGTKIKECFSCRGKGWVEQVRKTFLGSISRQVVCPECQGEGNLPEKPCNVCKGEGRIKQEEQISVYIPAGVDNGQVLRMKGRGEAGRRGGRAGDLLLHIKVKPHKAFKRTGDDLFVSLPITFSQAALGGEVEVPTLLDKGLTFKVPSGTESGKIFRISNKGIPHFQGSGRGHLFVELVVETPQKLTRQQKTLLKKLQSEGL